jgi:hypothetical protein
VGTTRNPSRRALRNRHGFVGFDVPPGRLCYGDITTVEGLKSDSGRGFQTLFVPNTRSLEQSVQKDAVGEASAFNRIGDITKVELLV